MSRHAYGSCHDEDCPACETEAERRKEDECYSDRERDFMADAAAADMVWGREW